MHMAPVNLCRTVGNFNTATRDNLRIWMKTLNVFRDSLEIRILYKLFVNMATVRKFYVLKDLDWIELPVEITHINGPLPFGARHSMLLKRKNFKSW
jgi:hypothetical protein